MQVYFVADSCVRTYCFKGWSTSGIKIGRFYLDKLASVRTGYRGKD